MTVDDMFGVSRLKQACQLREDITVRLQPFSLSLWENKSSVKARDREARQRKPNLSDSQCTAKWFLCWLERTAGRENKVCCH